MTPHDDQVLDAVLRHRLAGEGPSPDLADRIRSAVTASEAAPGHANGDHASAAASGADVPAAVADPAARPDPAPGPRWPRLRRTLAVVSSRQVVVPVMSVAATALIAVMLGFLLTDRPELPPGVRSGPQADYTVPDPGPPLRLDLHHGWLTVGPEAPPVQVGGNRIEGVTGRVLILPGQPPDADGRERIANELTTAGIETEQAAMVTNSPNWLVRSGLAMLVIAGSALINGQTVSAQDFSGPKDIPVLLAWHGDDAAADRPSEYLFLQEARWKESFAAWFPDREVPTVDFKRCMVVAIINPEFGGFRVQRSVESGSGVRLDYQSLPRDDDAGDGAGFALFVLPRLIGPVTVQMIVPGGSSRIRSFVSASVGGRVRVVPVNGNDEPDPDESGRKVGTVLAVSGDDRVVLELPEGTDLRPNRRLVVLRTTDNTSGDPIAELVVDSVTGTIAVCEVVWQTAPARTGYRVVTK